MSAIVLVSRNEPIDQTSKRLVEAHPGYQDLPSPPAAASLPELPEADLRSALTDLCTSISREPGGGAWSPATAETQIEEFNELKRSISERLSVSPSAEHLHLAALLEGRSASRIELIDRAVSLNPNDALLLWGAVHICAEERDATSCPLHDLERRLLEIDGQNSESWVRVAANRYEAGDSAAALTAMRHAATSAGTRAYWTETIEMVERGFAAGSDYAFPARAAMAVSLAAANLPDYGDYMTMCKEQSANSVEWAYACLAYGELVEQQGKTHIGVIIARSIQTLALEALGDEDKLAAVAERQQKHRQEMNDSARNSHPLTERLLLAHPAIFSAYLSAVRTHGEPGARAYLASETERMLRLQPELACNP